MYPKWRVRINYSGAERKFGNQDKFNLILKLSFHSKFSWQFERERKGKGK